MTNTRIERLNALYPTRSIGKGSYRALLEAAESLFVTRGIEDCTLTSILKEAGCGPQTLYDFFPDGKEDLVLMLHHYRHRRMKHTLRSATQHVVLSNMELGGESSILVPIYAGVRILVGAMFRTLREKPVLDRVLTTYLAEHKLGEDTTQEEATVQSITDSLGAVTQGKLPDPIVKTMAFMLTFGCRGMVEGGRMLGQEGGVSAEMEALFISGTTLLIAQQITAQETCPGCPTTSCSLISQLGQVKHSGDHVALPDEPVTSTVPAPSRPPSPGFFHRLRLVFPLVLVSMFGGFLGAGSPRRIFPTHLRFRAPRAHLMRGRRRRSYVNSMA